MELNKSKLMTVKDFLKQGYLFEEGDEYVGILNNKERVGVYSAANEPERNDYKRYVLKAKCLGDDYPNNYDPVTKKIKPEVKSDEIVTYEKVTFKTLFDALNCKYELVEEVDHYPATEKYIANRYLNSLQRFTDFTLYKKVTISRKQQFVTDCQVIANKYLMDSGVDFYKRIYDEVVLPMIKEDK